MRRFVAVLALLLVGGAVWLSPPAGAHALAQSSDPAPGSTVAHAPPAVTIVFGERPEVSLSSITVLNASGAKFDQGGTRGVSGNSLALQVSVKSLPKGVYTVSWRTVSAVDSHVATGAFAFGVQVAPTAAATAKVARAGAPRPSTRAVAGRWALYLGLVTVVGAAFIGGLAFRQTPKAVVWLLAAGWLLATAGTVVITLVEHADAGVSWSRLYATAVGHKLLVRQGAIGLLTITLAGATLLRKRLRRPLVPASGVAGGLALLADVASSHAAAGSRPTFNQAIQLLHVLAVGVWIGGLVALLVATRGPAADDKAVAVRRFSSVAGVGLAVVFATGVYRASVEIGRWDKVLSTGFGQLVMAKVAVIAALAGLGARNRWRHVPAADSSLRGLRRVGAVEVVLGASALLLAATLVNVAPPASARPRSAPTVRPIVASGADYGTTTRIRLQVAPGVAGFNRFTVRATDYDSGAPIRDATVQLGFTLPQRPDVGASTLDLKPAGAGIYQGDGANLSIFGTWRVRVLVQQSTTSVEVPFTVTTRVPAEQIDVSRAAGAPTVYTAHLSGSRTVQIYIDPGKAGFNELHVTYISPTQTALDVPDVVIAPATAGGSPGSPYTVRRLDVGHFVADVTAKRGPLRVLVVGTTGDGEQLPTLLTLQIV
ncbi:MAG TPA: copper resistance protein CopC [Acidimicrobiales bacterium]|nr:copper resistance protein CopC [Acidimicrobiales bacterium]